MNVRAGLVCTILCGVAALALPSVAGADIGFQGPAYPAGTSGSPTASKPESKVWWNDGFWWASMSAANGQYHIFRLNRTTQRWGDTGVVIDTRRSTRQDVLSVGRRLFVASHKFQETTTRDDTPMAADEMRFYRFSYNAATNRYSLDGTSAIDSQRSETLVIDRDSTGALWATWVQQESVGGPHQVYVKRTNGNCVSGTFSSCQWTLAGALDTQVSSDDISSIIRFGGNKLGVAWTDNSTAGVSALRFATHVDGTQFGQWTTETASSGAKAADDHINLKADSAGRVYAVGKTKFISAANPGIVLHRRNSPGNWTHATVSNGALRRTRPIVLLDNQNNLVRVFEGTERNNAVYMKRSRLNVLSFSTGTAGALVVQDTGSRVLNPTSTKQNVGNTTQLIVLATNDRTRRYWHAYQQLAPCIRGTAGNNRLIGTRANDRLCGGGGNDVLGGLGGNDRLIGGPGNDRLVGHAGKDAFFGQGGNDRFWSRDTYRELVAGGPGFDRARVNAADVRRSIERLF
jgi:Ca2+-binding RTX toxin-like protein